MDQTNIVLGINVLEFSEKIEIHGLIITINLLFILREFDTVIFYF